MPRGPRMAEAFRVSAPMLERLGERAPPHPPCFLGRTDWLEWLALAHAATEPSGVRPDGSVSSRIDFCSDCSVHHAQRMASIGRCKPDFLMESGDE